MRPNNKQLVELLNGAKFKKKSLGPQVIDQEFKRFSKLVQTNNQSIVSHNLFNKIFSKYFNIMKLAKNIAVTALAAVIGIGAVSTGYDKVMAFELASQIQHSSEAGNYKMDLSFSNVFFNGHVVSKEYVIKKSIDGYNKVEFFGGSTKGASVTPESIKEAQAHAIVPSEEELANSYLADGSPALKKTITSEDAGKNSIPTLPENKDFISNSENFKRSVKFLELVDSDSTTFVGVDKDGELLFFEKINN